MLVTDSTCDVYAPVRQQSTPVRMRSAFSQPLCDLALEIGRRHNFSTAHQTSPDLELRYCHSAWMPRDSSTEALYLRLEQMFLIANSYYRFECEGIKEDLLMAEYREKGHFAWHTDNWPPEVANRKIACVVMLSEDRSYQGGELEFCPHHEHGLHRKGSAVLFPAYMAHRVTAVTTGTRRILVSWIHGPAFR
jgi:PKHD-type hydroxylase